MLRTAATLLRAKTTKATASAAALNAAAAGATAAAKSAVGSTTTTAGAASGKFDLDATLESFKRLRQMSRIIVEARKRGIVDDTVSAEAVEEAIKAPARRGESRKLRSTRALLEALKASDRGERLRSLSDDATARPRRTRSRSKSPVTEKRAAAAREEKIRARRERRAAAARLRRAASGKGKRGRPSTKVQPVPQPVPQPTADRPVRPSGGRPANTSLKVALKLAAALRIAAAARGDTAPQQRPLFPDSRYAAKTLVDPALCKALHATAEGEPGRTAAADVIERTVTSVRTDLESMRGASVHNATKPGSTDATAVRTLSPAVLKRLAAAHYHSVALVKDWRVRNAVFKAALERIRAGDGTPLRAVASLWAIPRLLRNARAAKAALRAATEAKHGKAKNPAWNSGEVTTATARAALRDAVDAFPTRVGAARRERTAKQFAEWLAARDPLHVLLNVQVAAALQAENAYGAGLALDATGSMTTERPTVAPPVLEALNDDVASLLHTAARKKPAALDEMEPAPRVQVGKKAAAARSDDTATGSKPPRGKKARPAAKRRRAAKKQASQA